MLNAVRKMTPVIKKSCQRFCFSILNISLGSKAKEVFSKEYLSMWILSSQNKFINWESELWISLKIITTQIHHQICYFFSFKN